MNSKIKLRRKSFDFLKNFGDNLFTKFSNICSKTGSYNVPLELFQKRTSRKNRCLIPWISVLNNNLTFEQLNTFEGGVVVDFVNYDYFNKDYYSNDLFVKLKSLLGSNNNVSSIISLKTDDGSSSSYIQRKAFDELTNNTKIIYNNEETIINKNNFFDFALKKIKNKQGQGNDAWTGFLFISIKGGQQDTIETHKNKNITLFNPACEYASSDVCEDINLVMVYYALKSINRESFNQSCLDLNTYLSLVKDIENMLNNIYYDFFLYKGNLLNFVKNHYSTRMILNYLTDPIQAIPITIDKFNISMRTEDSIDLAHNESVFHDSYYWDNVKKCILSSARPTNVFWSYHFSNMVQQNYKLDEYFKLEEERVNRRNILLKTSGEN